MDFWTLICFGAFLFFIIRWAVHGADNQGVGQNRKRRPRDPDADVDDV
jgi:hypothetical protein